MNDEELNTDKILEIFYSTKGGIDKVNAEIDARLKPNPNRSLTLFGKYVESRLLRNPKILRLADMEITALEVIYLSQQTSLQQLEVLDLRKNGFGDVGLDAIAHSEIFSNLRELDLRNNQITRLGMESLAKTSVLVKLEKLDLRTNKMGKRWEEKLLETGVFPKLTDLKVL
jgi:Ran GTPase-activating protein (RanGAP) involved in mRNA processing and transport